MKNLFFLIVLLGLSSVFINAQSDLWTDVSESQIEQVGERYIIPSLYRTVKLNIDVAKPLLNSSPMEFTEGYRNGAILIPLPMPDGSFQNFAFWESPTMEQELQEMFPEIRTYTGQGIDDPYATLKFDLTPHGFHAQILSPNGRVFIDPHSQGDIHNYISYYTKDFFKDAEFTCQLEYDEYVPNYNFENMLTPTGPQLRTYRLANAATGEYTIFHGGTVPLGLAAVTTSVNRVNGVYEREAAIRMVLVANNNLIIYTNPSTDPYTNSNGGTMLGQNISNLSSVIGNANFDIGHVFSTGGGGVAYLGCVCTSNKAGGVTGQSAPIGDPFDIDYVAHEMGHQFGANHTFNGTAGACTGGNRNGPTAYEPGSGSTIMAYAGICSPQNLQNNSDPYFHVISFDEMVAFTHFGSGNSCAVITNTGNSAPIVANLTGGFYIPKSTPFALTGSATDPNGDAMTYCWEEFDLGVAGAPGSPTGDAPIFRSFNPTTSPTRTFPKLTDLLNNTTTIGELLPTYARNLKFRLTVRDNRAGGGGVDWKQINFAVDGNSGPFVVTSPNTGVSWAGNSSQTITWSVANTNVSPVNCTNVRILLSTNGGISFNTVLLASTPNDGSEVVTIPNLPTAQARIKVEAVGNIFFDISNVNFTIVNNPIPDVPASLTSTAVSPSQINLAFTPNALNNNVVIVWNTTGTFTTPSGPPPAVGNPFAGGTLLYNGTLSPQIHSGLTMMTNYYYRAFSYNGSNYSAGLNSNALTLMIEEPESFAATAMSSSEISVAFAPNNFINDVVIVWNNSGTFTTPIGVPPAVGESFAGGTIFYNGLLSPQLHSDLTPQTDYYYRAFSYDGINYSSGYDAEATTFPVSSTFQLTVSISAGWNMVSIPGLHPVNQHADTWFPYRDITASIFKFDLGYSAVDTLEPGTGYYLKHSGDRVYNTGDEWPAGGINIVPNTPINANAGWNMFGGYHLNVPTAAITTTPSGLQSGQIFGYSGGYFPVANLEPGYGYWIKLSAPGQINIPNSFFDGSAKISEINTNEWGRITLSDNSGKSYTLFIVDEKNSNTIINLNDFELPPTPPAEMFDIRFTSGKYAEKLSTGFQTISMQGVEYPVVVRVENISIILRDETGGGLNTGLKSGDEIIISNSLINKLIVSKNIIPVEFSLGQNYPNPFNPSTEITWQSPVSGHQTLRIYDILGNEVATLVDEYRDAGSYTITFDASELASGIYVYTLQSGAFIQTKKMVLAK